MKTRRKLPAGYDAYIRSHEWIKRSRAVRALTLNSDALIPFLPAHDAHHMTYNNFRNELPIRDLIPLNHDLHILWLHKKVIGSHQNSHEWLINLGLRTVMIFWLVVLFLPATAIVKIWQAIYKPFTRKCYKPFGVACAIAFTMALPFTTSLWFMPLSLAYATAMYRMPWK